MLVVDRKALLNSCAGGPELHAFPAFPTFTAFPASLLPCFTYFPSFLTSPTFHALSAFPAFSLLLWCPCFPIFFAGVPASLLLCFPYLLHAQEAQRLGGPMIIKYNDHGREQIDWGTDFLIRGMGRQTIQKYKSYNMKETQKIRNC